MLVQRKSAGDGINPIDKFLRQHTSDRVQRVLGARRSHLMAKSLYDVILSLSDTQLVTGTAMLVAALYKLNETGSISIYHLSIVEDSCFIIPSIHSFTFFALRTRTESSESASEDTGQARRRKKPTGIEWSLILRVALTLSLNVMLFYIRWTSAYVDWDSKSKGHSTMGVEESSLEDTWGFGQLVPLLLLTLPVLQWLESMEEGLEEPETATLGSDNTPLLDHNA
ncbi:hypothetical protein VM1G_07645 [Cytospora mali]|uniref:Uncharacterized protein n=1 Tax=Cytospora mali TaxID=578113 RepID=A0A194W8Q1_CYTMA|nr:hypothetical protein VM1G_07645 [Valsa mali]